MSKSIEKLIDLPIDQYSRQKWASNFIDLFSSGTNDLSILDVGGYKGKTAQFHPDAKVTICDLFDVNEPNYVKGDGRRLPFKDNEFDFVVSFDTYEHVPREGREQFIEELTRVGKEGVILAAPFDDPAKTVSSAELDLNQYYMDLYNENHPWLKEHIEYKIPQQAEIENLIKKVKYQFSVLPSNDISTWMMVQSIYFSINLDEDLRGRVDDINRFYNSNLLELDVPSLTSYRKIYFISDTRENLIATKQYINKIGTADSRKKEEFLALALSIFGKKYRDVENYKQYLEGELEKFKLENDALRQQQEVLQQQIKKPILKKTLKKFKVR